MTSFKRLPFVASLFCLNFFLLFSVTIFGQTPCETDTIAPVFQNCPANINLTTAGTNAIATWATPTATDNCSYGKVNLGNYSSGFAFPLGVSNVVFTATDAKANQGFCRFNVAVTSQSIVKDVCANPAANIVGKTSSITITGIKTGAAIIQIFNSSWNSVYNQQVSVDSITIPNLAVGTYNVKVTVLETGGRWPSVCEVTQNNVVVTAATNTCENGTLSFDGINDFFITNSAAIPANTDFTFEALCKSRATETVCSGAFKRLLTLTLDNSNERLEIGDCSGQLTVYRNTPTASNGLYEISNANTLRNGAWHHIAAVKKSDSLYVYYDGVKVLTIGGVATINSIPRRFVMGSWVQNIDNWNGEIDEVRVWNYAASANQIQTLKQCQMVGNESGLVLYYPFNQGVAGGNNSTELTVIDKTTSGVNATLNQFSLSGETSNWICSNLALTQGCPLNACDNDVIAPIFTNCPTNIIFSTTGVGAIINWVAPSATDNCGTPSISSNYISGATFPMGITKVIYTATDAKGNKAECNFNVELVPPSICDIDTIKPILSNCPANISLTTIGTTAIATWTAPTATDNCTTGPSVLGTKNSGFAFPIGISTVTYTATDAKSNSSTCSFNVTVTQQSSSSDICTNPTANIVGGAGSITVTGITTSSAAIQVFTSTWNSVFNQQISSTSVTIPNLAVGKYIVKVTVLGTGGKWPAVCNVQEENVSVTSGTNPCATDVTPPTFSNCPTNIKQTTSGTTSIATWTAPTATDNCGTPSVLSNNNSGFAFPLGTTAVTYTATDAKGNKATCSFDVTVSQSQCGIDTIKPVISNCPPDQTVTTTGTSAIATWTPPTATDNCGLKSFFGSRVSGSSFPLGSNIPSYTAIDSANNQSTCVFFINVVKETSTGSTVCTNPSANVVGGNGIITVSGITTNSAIIQVFTSGWVNVGYFTATTSPYIIPNIPNGTYNVKITVLNAGGSWPSICTVQADNVVVGVGTNPCATDVTPPVLVNCPTNINLITTGTTAVGTWVAPTATDNCTANPSLTSDYNSGYLFPIGTTAVTYTATDLKGNKSTCRFNVAISAQNNTCQLVDSLALVDLYNSTNGANWTTKWDLNQPISTWYGLLFNPNGCLRYLSLLDNNLVGTIPASIGNIVELDYINLSKNKLTGVIPTTIGKLSKLTRLFLNYNQLSGTIPSEIGNLPVIFLELTKNQLSGSIPQNLGKLQYPVAITLDSNLLTGCIPIEMKSFCNSNNIRINGNAGLPNGGDWAAFCSSEAGSCSANTVNDLAVSISANPSVYKKFTILNTVITLKNNSNQAMANIEVNVPTPKGTSGGRTATRSVGNWQPYCTGGVECNRWVIPTLAANTTATLSIPLFVLDVDTAIVATARLTASTPADNNVSNNFASIAIAPETTQQIQALSIRKPTQYIPVIIQKISPNPTDGDVYIDVESLDERDMRFEFFNAQGQNVYNEMQHLKKGSNQLHFNITDKESGLYFVKPETSGGRNVPVKFVKL
jgi:hypothetical protein